MGGRWGVEGLLFRSLKGLLLAFPLVNHDPVGSLAPPPPADCWACADPNAPPKEEGRGLAPVRGGGGRGGGIDPSKWIQPRQTATLPIRQCLSPDPLVAPVIFAQVGCRTSSAIQRGRTDKGSNLCYTFLLVSRVQLVVVDNLCIFLLFGPLFAL